MFVTNEGSFLLRKLIGLWLLHNENIVTASFIVIHQPFTDELVDVRPICDSQISAAVERNKKQTGGTWSDYCINFANDPTFAADTLHVGAAVALFETTIRVYALQGENTNTDLA